MKNLAEYVTESINKGRSSFTKEELSKDLAEAWYKVFGDIVERYESSYGMDFEVTGVDLEPVSSKDKAVLIKNRKELLKVLLPKFKELEKEIGKKYTFHFEWNDKKPQKDTYFHWVIFIEDEIIDWDTNYKTVGSRGFYTYDPTQKKVLNLLSFDSRDLDTLDKYLTK